MMSIAAPTIVSRSEWGASPLKGQPVAQPAYRFLTVHHAAGFSASEIDEGRAQVKRIQRLHQESNGWADIGYHFLIDTGGHVYQGRPYLDDLPLAEKPRLIVGAHVEGRNSGNIGVCLLGCFHPEANPSTCNEVLTEAAGLALVRLLAFLCEGYGIVPTNIKGHRDFASTACPGSNLHPRLPEVRWLVQQSLVAPPPPALDAEGGPGAASVTRSAAAANERWTAALRAARPTGASAVTAAQDGLASGVGASQQMARTDLPRVLALKDAFALSGATFDIPPALLAAVASRESRCGNALAPDGTGDHGNGFGIMQVDKRFHAVIGGPRSQAHINQASEILAKFRQQVQQKHPEWADEHVLKGAIVAYNSGMRNVQTIARMDMGTTGNDYGADVLARGQFYLQHL